MAEKIKLSISILASRKREQVKRCLDSVLPVMEEIPSELILVDTSGDASLHEMLLTYTDQVVEFTWCNDFSKARNVGLSLAKGEWFLYLDDDEWFADYAELVRFFQSGEYKKYGCANYIQRNFHDPEYMHYSDAWASRMIRLGKNTRFRSKIHEYLYPQEGEGINLHVIVNHSGYIYQTEEDKEKHFKRNYPLLLDMMKEEPQRLRWRVQIVQELYTMHKWEELQAFCKESLDFSKDRTDEWDSRDVGTFYAGLSYSQFKLGRYTDCLNTANITFSDSRTSELCHAYLALLMAQCRYCMGDHEVAKSCICQYFSLQKELEKNRRRLEIQQGALLVESAFDEISLKRAYSLLIAIGLKQQDAQPLQKYLDKLEWDQKVIYVSDEIFPALIEGMALLPPEPVFVKAMQQMWNNTELGKKMFPAIQAWEEKDVLGFGRLVEIAAQVQGDHWYLWYCKILAADRNQDPSHLAELFRGFCNHTPDLFATPERITEIMKKYGVSPEDGYLSVSFARWQEHLHAYIAKVPLLDILLTEQNLNAMKTREDIRYEYAFLCLAMARAAYSASQKNFETKRTCLSDFGKLGSAFALRYYQNDILQTAPELLPDYLQAALFLQEAFSLESTQPKSAALLWGEAAKVCPQLADAVKAFLLVYDEETQKRKQAAREELRELEEKVKAQAVRCIEQGQYEDALAILAELKQLKPNDLEVAKLTLQARLGQLGDVCQERN